MNNGVPKPGGKLLPDPFFLAVKITICPYCKKVYKSDFCDCEKE